MSRNVWWICNWKYNDFIIVSY